LLGERTSRCLRESWSTTTIMLAKHTAGEIASRNEILDYAIMMLHTLHTRYAGSLFHLSSARSITTPFASTRLSLSSWAQSNESGAAGAAPAKHEAIGTLQLYRLQTSPPLQLTTPTLKIHMAVLFQAFKPHAKMRTYDFTSELVSNRSAKARTCHSRAAPLSIPHPTNIITAAELTEYK
jgi:hypothetical protein